MFGTNKSLNQIKTALIKANIATMDSTDSEVAQAVIDLVNAEKVEVKAEEVKEEPQAEEKKEDDKPEEKQEDWKIALAQLTAKMTDMSAQIVAIAKSGQPSPTATEKETNGTEPKKERAYMKNPINKGVKMAKLVEE
jgi:predicted RNA-binding protein with RPS1 domain